MKLLASINMRIGEIKAASTVQKLAGEVAMALTNIREAEVRTPPRTVTYVTNMNTDVAGTLNEIVYCSTDSTTYVCSKTGKAGHATWSSGVSVSDHGTTTGLADDDHAQYLLTDGSRTITPLGLTTEESFRYMFMMGR